MQVPGPKARNPASRTAANAAPGRTPRAAPAGALPLEPSQAGTATEAHEQALQMHTPCVAWPFANWTVEWISVHGKAIGTPAAGRARISFVKSRRLVPA